MCSLHIHNSGLKKGKGGRGKSLRNTETSSPQPRPGKRLSRNMFCCSSSYFLLYSWIRFSNRGNCKSQKYHALLLANSCVLVLLNATSVHLMLLLLLAREAGPHWGVGRKTSYWCPWPVWCVYVGICHTLIYRRVH